MPYDKDEQKVATAPVVKETPPEETLRQLYKLHMARIRAYRGLHCDCTVGRSEFIIMHDKQEDC